MKTGNFEGRNSPTKFSAECRSHNFKTLDREEFEHHMLSLHNKKKSSRPFPESSTQSLSNRAKGKWNVPNPRSSLYYKDRFVICPNCNTHIEVTS